MGGREWGGPASVSIPLIDLSDVDPLDGVPHASMVDRNHRKMSHQQLSEDAILSERSQELFEAACNGDINKVRSILNICPEAVTYRDMNKCTPLHYACRYVHADIVNLLLKYNADTNAVDHEAWRPLHYAAKYFKRDLNREGGDYDDDSKSREETRQIINKLCQHKADVNAKEGYGCTPLHYAALRGNTEAAKTLLQYKADTHEKDSSLMTPFMVCIVYGKKEVFDELVSRSSKNDLDRRQNTILHIAAYHGRIDMITDLFSKEEKTMALMMFALNNEKKTPLQLAVEGDHPDVVRLLLGKYPLGGINKSERQLLHLAAYRGYVDVVKELVEKGGLGLDEEDADGRLPIHEAARNNQAEVIKYLLAQDPEKLTADVRDNLGFTPLLIATTTNGLEAVQVLLEKGAKLKAIERSGKNIIYLGAKYNSVKVLEYVLQYIDSSIKRGGPRANTRARMNLRKVASTEGQQGEEFIPPHQMKERMINKKDQNQDTPMHCACHAGYLESVRLLKEHGASLTDINEDEETPLHLACVNGWTNVVEQLLEWSKKLALAKDDQGRTPLHLAAKNGFDHSCQHLLNASVDHAAKNVYDETALDCAIQGGHLAVVKVLMDNGATPEPVEDKGCTTTLHLAATYGHPTVVQYLLDKDADVSRRDEHGRTALDLAIEGGSEEHKNVALVLLGHREWLTLLRPTGKLPWSGINFPRDTPMRLLIRNMPEVAKAVFDKCVESTSLGGADYEYKVVKYNFLLLDDTWLRVNDKVENELSCDLAAFDEDNNFNLFPDTLPYSQNMDMVYKNHPLRLMAEHKRETLLAHPLVLALLKHKWNNLGRYLYYFALTIYIVFIGAFTVYINKAPAPYNVYDQINGTYVDLSHSNASQRCAIVHYRSPLMNYAQVIVISLAAAQIIKELYQLYQRRLAYISFDNGLECFLYVSAILVVLDFGDCSRRTGIRLAWQWTLAAASAFLQWMNLLLLVRKLPRFGIYVVMFVDICKTFTKFFIIFALFVVAFSIAFFIVLQNRNEFNDVPSAILKTTVMMIGEFEFTAIFHGDKDVHGERLYEKEIAYPLFVFFAIVMTILLMNLLVGLAVDDIKAVQEKAALKRLSMQVDLVLQVECSILNYFRRRVAAGALIVSPHSKGWWQNLRSKFGLSENSAFASLEGAALQPDEKEQALERRLQMQHIALTTIQQNIDVMYTKQLVMEDLLKKISQKLGGDQGALTPAPLLQFQPLATPTTDQ